MIRSVALMPVKRAVKTVIVLKLMAVKIIVRLAVPVRLQAALLPIMISLNRSIVIAKACDQRRLRDYLNVTVRHCTGLR